MVDIPPELKDAWEDLNGNHLFEGCLDDPTCDEPLTDVNGNAPTGLATPRRGPTTTATSPQTSWESTVMALENVAYKMLGEIGIFEFGPEDRVYDAERCPHDGDADGCIASMTGRVQIGPVS